jgi:hypothetical protein
MDEVGYEIKSKALPLARYFGFFFKNFCLLVKVGQGGRGRYFSFIPEGRDGIDVFV